VATGGQLRQHSKVTHVWLGEKMALLLLMLLRTFSIISALQLKGSHGHNNI